MSRHWAVPSQSYRWLGWTHTVLGLCTPGNSYAHPFIYWQAPAHKSKSQSDQLQTYPLGPSSSPPYR